MVGAELGFYMAWNPHACSPLWSGHYLLLLPRCFCDLQTGPSLRPDSAMKCDKRGQRVTFSVQENPKIPQAKHLLSEKLLAEFTALGEDGKVIKVQYLGFPTIREAGDSKIG